MATDDEFSFPTVDKIRSSNNGTTIDSPPLWRLSPAATSTDDDDDDDDDDDEDHSAITSPVENYNQRKRFSCIKGELPKAVDDDQIIINTTTTEEEEKMDMLWEDFNEELYPIRSTATSDYNNYVSSEMLQLGCVGLGAFNLSKSTTTTTKPVAVVFVKVLKRLFFLHNSHQRSQPQQ